MHDRRYTEFYEGTWHRVLTYLYAVSGDRSTAQDLAQEAYARAWQRWDTVGEYADPEAWVRTVGYRLCLNRWRKARNRLKAYRGHLHGVVVHGDLATQYAVLDGSAATGRQLGVKARSRLCQATGIC